MPAGLLAPRSRAAKNAVGTSVASTLKRLFRPRGTSSVTKVDVPDHQEGQVEVCVVWLQHLLEDFCALDEEGGTRYEEQVKKYDAYDRGL